MGAKLPCIALALCLAAGVARADDRAAAREHYVKGTKAFDLGAFDEAIREYSEAYRIIDDPALLYNIAQSHRLAGHKSEALRFYKIYLSKGRAPNRDEVLGKINELQSAIDAEKKAQSSPPVEPIAPETKEAKPAAPVEPAPAVRAPVESVAAAPSKGRTLEIAGGVVLGVGLAVAVAGIAMAVIGNNAVNAVNDANANHLPYDPSKYSAAHTDPIAGGVLIGIGGAASVAGAAVLALGFKRAKASAFRVAPKLGPRVAGIDAEVRF